MRSFKHTLSILTLTLVLAASLAATPAPSDAHSLKREPILIEVGGKGSGGFPVRLGDGGLTRDTKHGKPILVEVGAPTGPAGSPISTPIKIGDHGKDKSSGGESERKLARRIEKCRELLAKNGTSHLESLPHKCQALLPQL